jgi:chromosome segregation ATPase
MALVNVKLNANLKPIEDQLVKIAESQGKSAESQAKIAAALEKQSTVLEAILAKLMEPEEDTVTQEQIDEWTAAIKASNDKLQAAGQQPVPVPEARRLSRSS